MNDFPKRLKIAISKKNMSQSELAQAIGISKSLITRYIQGSFLPKTEVLISMCKVLEVSPAYLLGKTDKMEDIGGIELIRFMKESTPEVKELDSMSIEDRHCAFIYGECKKLSLSQLEDIEDYINFIKSKK